MQFTILTDTSETKYILILFQYELELFTSEFYRITESYGKSFFPIKNTSTLSSAAISSVFGRLDC